MIPLAVKFMLLSSFFKLKTQVLWKSIMNYEYAVYGQNAMNEVHCVHLLIHLPACCSLRTTSRIFKKFDTGKFY
jgi:hypothetical protein